MDGRRLAFGAATMGVCNIGKIALQLALTPLLARLLGPAEFGLYGLAMPYVLFMMMLADASLGQSLAREPEDNQLAWSSAFWLLLGMGTILATALSLWSIPLALIAHQPRLPRVMTALSGSVVLLVLAALPAARLTRRGRIEIYAFVDLGGTVAGAAAALFCAAHGAGVWSLVVQMLTLYGIRALALNIAAFQAPRLAFSWRAVAPHSKMGGGVVAGKMIDSVGRMLEASLVSRRFGATHLGLYSFAYQAAWSISQAVNNPVWTALFVHCLNKSDDLSQRRLYERLIRLVAMITLPATALVAALAERICRDLLGPAWTPGALLLALLFPCLALGLLGQLSGAALYGRGRSKPQTIVSAVYTALRILAVLAPLGGWRGLAVLVALSNLAYFAIGLANAKITLGWPVSRALTAIAAPATSAAAAASLVWFAQAHAPAGLLAFVALGLFGATAYLVILAALDFPNVKRDVGHLVQMVAPSARSAG
ncbi:oligosaccharide flippase family protein [Phenylobacterium sp.]|jgi:PST family polysaccharide transporter|uniref:oligosaccharide flippase family protein n=1 Tax=Phenylobacterium sp. TaxID=1871053 RepID=UPI002F40BAC5